MEIRDRGLIPVVETRILTLQFKERVSDVVDVSAPTLKDSRGHGINFVIDISESLTSVEFGTELWVERRCWMRDFHSQKLNFGHTEHGAFCTEKVLMLSFSVHMKICVPVELDSMIDMTCLIWKISVIAIYLRSQILIKHTHKKVCVFVRTWHRECLR